MALNQISYLLNMAEVGRQRDWKSPLGLEDPGSNPASSIYKVLSFGTSHMLASRSSSFNKKTISAIVRFSILQLSKWREGLGWSDGDGANLWEVCLQEAAHKYWCTSCKARQLNQGSVLSPPDIYSKSSFNMVHGLCNFKQNNVGCNPLYHRLMDSSHSTSSTL